MAGELITVFGGSGFVGRYVVRALCRAGYRVRVATRNPHVAGNVKLAGDVGQVQLIQANVRNTPSIERALEGAHGVVNLVGILYEKGKQGFDTTQAQGAINIAEIAAARGIDKFVQISAIGADANSKSEYARTKAQAEQGVREHVPGAVILRPSIVFGPEDGFYNRFASMARISPLLPLIGGGKTSFQPVYAGDVADAVVCAFQNTAAVGRTFELGGPATYTFKEVLQYIQKETGRKRLFLPLPFGVAKVMGVVTNVIWSGLMFVFGTLFGGPPLTGDQVELLKSDNVVGISGEDDIGTIQDLGVTELEAVETIAPTYLYRYRTYGQFSRPTEAG